MLKGMRLGQELLNAKAFDAYRGQSLPGDTKLQSDAEIRAYISANAETIYHPVGTCKMGHDVMAVLNERL